MMQRKTLLFCVLMLIGGACSEGFTLEDRELVFDGVKYINPQIKKFDSDEAYSQGSYLIKPEGRLLLRYEKLSDYREVIALPQPKNREEVSALNPEIDPGPSPSPSPPIEEDLRARVELSVDDHLDTAIENLRICPVTSSWMILASWTHSSPISKWKSPGADYDESECLAAKEKSAQSLYFDCSDWIKNYLVSRQLNHGLLVKTLGREIIVLGENSMSGAPRLLFKEKIPIWEIEPIPYE